MWSVVRTAATGITWLFAARRLMLLLDRIKTVRIASLPVSPFEHDGGAFLIGNHPLDLRMLDGRRFDLPEWTRPPAPGDELSFTLERSLLPWPTPFAFNFMTGQTPSRKRHLYYRLVWKKRSGASLEMIWRYEEWYYPANGWTGASMTSQGSTGLVHARLKK
jgi:hypothetical protein